MKKPYYLSEDIYPECWESVSEAYNDLSVYTYQFIEYKSNKYHIPEELVGDAVLIVCERAFKYRYSYNPEISKLHNWVNKIIERVLINIYNKLPDEQPLDNIINKDIQNGDLDTYNETNINYVEMGVSPESNMVYDEVQNIRKEVAEALNNHIGNLRPIDRDIFIKAYVDDIPFKVIASEFGMTETAARKRAFDIKNRIRHRLPAITPWKLCDMTLCQKIEESSIPLCITEEDILLKLYPQYDTRKIEPEDTDTIEYENVVVAYELLVHHLEMCFDDYNGQAEENTDVYSELKEELKRRGRVIKYNEDLGNTMFIIEDDLDLIVRGPGSPELYIGFIYEFINIYTFGTNAASIADYIDDLHSLIDRMSDEIDRLIDIRD